MNLELNGQKRVQEGRHLVFLGSSWYLVAYQLNIMPTNRNKKKKSDEQRKKESDAAAIAAKKRQLIELVRDHPVIYDLGHVDHKNNAIKNVIWAEIAELLKEDGEYILPFYCESTVT